MTLKEIQAPKTHIKFTNVIFANGQWIFSGYEEIDYKPYLRIYVSKDLKVFNQLTLSNNYLFDYYTKINYVNGIYIIETEQYIYISTDLIVWKDIKENLRKVDSNFKNVNPILKFLNGQFYLIFYDDSKESIYVSSDLVSWSKKAEFNSQPEVQLESIIPDAFYQSKFYYCQKTSDHLYIKSTSDFYKSNNITNIFVETGI